MTDAETHEVLSASEDEIRAIMRYGCQSSLMTFVEAFWPVLEPGTPMSKGWVLEAMVEHLEAAERGEITRLLISVPPGSMKSLLTRAFFPAWVWARRPSTRFLGIAYAQQLAVRDNKKSRDIVLSELYQQLFPEVVLDASEAGKANFNNTAKGRMLASSVGGTVTGERGDFVVCDDLINVQQGDSEAERETANLFYKETLPTRLNHAQKSTIVIIGQRIHMDDPYQKAIDDGYEQLLIPAEYEPERAKATCLGWKDPRKEDGEIFWPDRFPKEVLDKQREILGIYGYSAQMQQNPVPREGGMIDSSGIRVVAQLPDEPYLVYEGWDLAAGEKKYNDFTARVVLLYYPKSRRFCVAYADHRRVNPAKVEQWLDSTVEEMKEGIGFGDLRNTTIILPQDPGQAGKAQRRYLARTLLGTNHYFEIPTGDKATRAGPFATAVGSGLIDMLEGPWNRDYLTELHQFPKGPHDDWVDATASAFNRAVQMTRKSIGASSLVSDTVENPFSIG